MHEVGRAKRAAGDSEGDTVELVTGNHGSLSGIRAIGRGGIRRPVVLGAEAFGWQSAEGAALGQHIVPKLLRRARIRIDACQADDGNGGVGRFQGIGYRLSTIGYRLLAIGYWLLAIGYWLIAIPELFIEARSACAFH